MNVTLFALSMLHAGLSVIPVKLDGSKAPAVRWKPYQSRLANDDELVTWFERGEHGVAIVCGAVSNNVEVIDFDAAELFEVWARTVETAGGGELLQRLPLIRTPGPGYHVPYRCNSPVGRSQKLAMKLVDGKPVVTIETRGEGSYVVTVGSPPTVHPNSGTYEMIRGSWTELPVLDEESRELLLSSARSLNEYVPETHMMVATSNVGNRPGDTFDASWDEILTGWTRTYVRADGTTLWARPGKKQGHSATTNWGGSDMLYVFSTSCHPLEAGRAYSKFAAYAFIHHNGDFSKAASAIRRKDTNTKTNTNTNSDSDNHDDSFERSDIGAARHFVERYGENLKYIAEHRAWYIWDGARWVEDIHNRVLAYAQEHAETLFKEAWHLPDKRQIDVQVRHALRLASRAKLETVVKLAESDAGINISQHALDAGPLLLNVRNGIVDLGDGSLHPHDRNALLTKMAGTEYHPDAECKTWMRFLREITDGREDLIRFLQLAAGYTLTADTSEQCVIIAHGSGANGKSTFLETIAAVMGDYAKRTSFDTFTVRKHQGPREDLAYLVGARLVLSGEPNMTDLLDEGMIKLLTGGEQIMCRRLYGTHFEYKPTYKIWIGCNHRPNIRGTDQGIWRRIRLVPFDVTFPPERQDKNLQAKLLQEAPGILRWMVAGCTEWLWNGLETPVEVTNATRDYREDLDPLGDFIAARCDINPTFSVTSGALYRAYLEWCEAENVTPVSQKRVTLYLQERGFKRGRSRTGERRIEGLALKAELALIG